MPKKPSTEEAQRRLDRLRPLVDRAGGPAEFARKNPPVDPTYVSQLLNGHRSFGEKAARAMEERCNLPRGYFDADGAQNTVAADQVVRAVPLISWVQAGTWGEVVDNLPVGAFDDLIKTTVPVGKHAFALRVVGDSMTNPGSGPSFPEGMVLIVDPDLSAEPRDFVVVRQNGDTECTFKQLVRDGHQWFLKPLNPRYPILEMREDAVIVGVVRQAALTFR